MVPKLPLISPRCRLISKSARLMPQRLGLLLVGQQGPSSSSGRTTQKSARARRALLQSYGNLELASGVSLNQLRDVAENPALILEKSFARAPSNAEAPEYAPERSKRTFNGRAVAHILSKLLVAHLANCRSSPP
jgi:hypothetical protein